MRVQSKEGWSIVYSGDTRPCSAVEQLASGATVLIHEVKKAMISLLLIFPCRPLLMIKSQKRLS